MALDMGAKYRQDWGTGCTHLVCAFKNTPKYRDVKGSGKIVSKNWIPKCHKEKKR
jgi:DNA-repair protein XRCC1